MTQLVLSGASDHPLSKQQAVTAIRKLPLLFQVTPLGNGNPRIFCTRAYFLQKRTCSETSFLRAFCGVFERLFLPWLLYWPKRIFICFLGDQHRKLSGKTFFHVFF
jgi:hypothetical protein